jgi:predicted aspartyl protease
MKINLDRAERISVSLANGAEIKARAVTLASIRVAGATIENVPAVVLPDAPGDHLDGLLGMSFLREFDLQYDTARGQILLRRLPGK